MRPWDIHVLSQPEQVGLAQDIPKIYSRKNNLTSTQANTNVQFTVALQTNSSLREHSRMWQNCNKMDKTIITVSRHCLILSYLKEQIWQVTLCPNTPHFNRWDIHATCCVGIYSQRATFTLLFQVLRLPGPQNAEGYFCLALYGFSGFPLRPQEITAYLQKCYLWKCDCPSEKYLLLKISTLSSENLFKYYCSLHIEMK